jgi:FtsP/CotA-like multicopper oxidase with cupredoxin domain
MTITVDLLAAITAHLAEFELPATASVHVTERMSGPQVTVQLSCRTPSAIARGLLAWADTLTDVSAEAWRVPRGDSVHLSVTGRLPGGTAVLVYGGLGATHCAVASDLAPDATATIPLAALRHTATEGEARA